MALLLNRESTKSVSVSVVYNSKDTIVILFNDIQVIAKTFK